MIIKISYFCFERFVQETSSSCNLEVSPLGITAKSVFFSRNRFFTVSVLWPENESITKRDFGLLPLRERFVQIFSIHHIISSSFIYPWEFAWITAPSWNSSQGIFLSLKIITGGSLIPLAKQANTMIKFDRLWPIEWYQRLIHIPDKR